MCRLVAAVLALPTDKHMAQIRAVCFEREDKIGKARARLLDRDYDPNAGGEIGYRPIFGGVRRLRSMRGMVEQF
jgi:hypothetical protein